MTREEEELEILRNFTKDMFNSRGELQGLLEETIEKWKKPLFDQASKLLKEGYSPLREANQTLTNLRDEVQKHLKEINGLEHLVGELEQREVYLMNANVALETKLESAKKVLKYLVERERKNISDDSWQAINKALENM